MLKRRDQAMLSEAYSQVGGGDVSAPSLMGKPVMITMDMPGAEVETGEDESDSEYGMVFNDLHKLSKYAAKLHELVSSGKELEDWEISKITKAAVYISDVHDALEYGDCDDEDSMYDKGYEDTCECEYAASGCKCGGCSDCQ
jgi:hypothetical protein